MRGKVEPLDPDPTLNLNKITPPGLQHVLANRRLFDRLDAAREHRIVWIHGPPGAGKTTLAASYLAARDIVPLWYRLDEGDTDPATLFYYLAAAGRRRRNGPPALPLLTLEFRTALPLFTRRFFRDLFVGPETATVVFDDYHEVAAGAPLHECLPHGLEEVPAGCQVVIIGRTPPPPPLARLRLNGLVDVVDPAELRMTISEAGALARQRGATESAARVEQITLQAQGWAAGVILMLEAGEADRSPSPHDGTSVPEVLFDYFATEILHRMHASAQRLLCILALMPASTAAAAERLTGAADVGLLLEDLRLRNYFTSRDTALEPRYRFHPLFRDFLLECARTRLSQEDLTDLRIRAAGILDDDGQPDAAVRLLAAAAAFDHLAAIVKRRAATLLGEGRNDTLVAWLAMLPTSLIGTDSWLSYWSGMARQQFDPQRGLPRLRDAFALFEKEDNATGQYLAWAGLAETLRMDALGDQARYDPLVASFRELLARHPNIPSGAMLPVSMAMATALARRSNDRAETELWQDRARSAANAVARPGLSELIGFMFLNSDFHDAKYAAARCALEQLPDPLTLDHAPSAQANGLIAHTMALAYRQKTGDCSAYAEEAIRRFEAMGYTLWPHLLAGFAANDARRRGDLAESAAWLQRMAAYADRVTPHRGAQYHYTRAQHHILSGDLAAAKAHGETAVTLGAAAGWPLFEGMGRLALAEVLVESLDFAEAEAELDRLDRLLARSSARSLAFPAALLRSDIHFAAGDAKGGTAVLAEAMALGRRQDDRRAALATGRVARLCDRALKSNIEPDYVRGLIRHAEVPAADPHNAAWPWPLRITTLGGLAVIKDGEPLTFSRKTPKRLIALLKAFVAFGGRNVPEEKLVDAVWPDEEGDSGQNALRIAIHRLRKLLGGGNAVIVSGGCLSLDPSRCWLDLWTVEHLLSQSDDDDEPGPGCHARTEQIFALYRGDFLAGDDDAAWTAPCREQLRRRFSRMVGAFAERHCGADVLRVYERGLAAAPEAEDLYQGVMRYHLANRRRADGIATYARLRGILGKRASTALTEALHRKLLALGE